MAEFLSREQRNFLLEGQENEENKSSLIISESKFKDICNNNKIKAHTINLMGHVNSDLVDEAEITLDNGKKIYIVVTEGNLTVHEQEEEDCRQDSEKMDKFVIERVL